MALPLAVPIAIGAAKAGAGILGSFGAQSDEAARTRAQNQAAVNQYKQKLKIRERNWLNTQQLYATRLGNYQRDMNEFDRAAAQGYGREQLKQNEALRAANLNRLSQSMALAQATGRAAASGKSGRSASRIDQNAIGQFVRNQGVMAENLLSGDIARSQRMMDIRNQLRASQNRAFSKVAIAPQQPMEPLKPTQLSGPSNMSLLSGIGTSILDGVTTGMSLAAPNTGGPGGGITGYDQIGTDGLTGAAAGGGANAYLGLGGKYGNFVPPVLN